MNQENISWEVENRHWMVILLKDTSKPSMLGQEKSNGLLTCIPLHGQDG